MDYPKSDANARLHNDKFTDGDPVNGVPASRDSAAHQNMVFDELTNAITAGGESPDEAKNDQLATIIKKVMSGGRVLGEPFLHLGETPPVGALQFGSQVLNRIDYAELWDALNNIDRNITWVSDADYLAGRFGCWSTGDGAATFRVPEPRGDFIRIFDNGRGVNQSQALGQFAEDELKSHDHEYVNMLGGGVTNSTSNNAASTSNVSTPNGRNTALTGGTETRPRSIAWMLCFWYQ